MSKEKIQELRLKYLDLFKNDNSKFDLFVQSMDSDYLKIKKHLKSMTDEEKNDSFVYRNFDLWAELLSGLKEIPFPTHKTKKKINDSWHEFDQDEYFYEKNGKDCFKFKSFISDLLEAKAMVDCPGNPSGRYSMLKSELIKHLKADKKTIQIPAIKAESIIEEEDQELLKTEGKGIQGIISGGMKAFKATSS